MLQRLCRGVRFQRLQASSHASVIPLLSQKQAGVHMHCHVLSSASRKLSTLWYTYAEGRTFGQRHRRRRSMLKSTQWGTGMDECLDEMQYDSTSVDDWGVNRDMQKAYRFIACCF